jgi:hypothetical protein
MADEITNTNTTKNASFASTDIVFNCGACGKSLVINALGAGLAITCPDCGAELQVPLSSDPNAANSAIDPNAATAATDNQKVENELADISDVLADAREQISALTLENDELHFRRRFLEKRYACASQSLQALRREFITIRNAMDRTEAILKTMEELPANDTQKIV